MSEGDHPLFLASVVLKDGRTGTIVHVYDHGAAFMLELSNARGIEDLITILSHEIADVDYSPYDRAAALIAIAETVRSDNPGNINVTDMSSEDFTALMRSRMVSENDGYRIITEDEQVELRDDAKRIRGEFLELRSERRALSYEKAGYSLADFLDDDDDDCGCTMSDEDFEALCDGLKNVREMIERHDGAAFISKSHLTTEEYKAEFMERWGKCRNTPYDYDHAMATLKVNQRSPLTDEFMALSPEEIVADYDHDDTITYQDETDYLISSPANAERLYRGIDQVLNGETFERPLFELHDDGSITLDGEEIETTDVTHMTKEQFIEFLREEDGE